MAKNKKATPLSESSQKFMAKWAEQDCIDELQRIAKIDTTKVITRNYFRNHATCSESTWNRYFGTFLEFKRQAGLVLTRQQHHLEKQIAKHASVDHYREFNVERQEYASKYIRTRKVGHKVILFLSDLHDIECDSFFLSVVIDTVKRIQPDVVVFNGDIFDLPEFGKYSVDPRQWNPVGRIKFVHDKIFAPMREAAPDAQFDLIEGNHEFRLLRHLCDGTQALKTVLSDLHGFTVAKLLGLDKFEINYIAKADLAAYTVSNISEEIGRNYKQYFGTVLAHHFPQGSSLGMPGINGHHHTWHVRAMHNETFGSYQWVQGGCGHVRDATYANGEKWFLNFNIAHVLPGKRLVNWDCIGVTDMAVVGGKYYHRPVKGGAHALA